MTQVVEKSNLAYSIELNANIIADNNSSGKVQPTLSGRVEILKSGMPNIGQFVKKGQVLAYIKPSAGNIEQSNQKAQLVELNSNYVLIKAKLNRLKQLEDTIPKKDIEATQNELISLKGRIKAINKGLITKEVLLAPVSGKISQANTVSGQVVNAGDTLFEIINPNKVRIEALSFDTNIINNITNAYLLNNTGDLLNKNQLKYIGSSGILKEQSLPLHFLLASSNQQQNLVIGQQVKVVIQTKDVVYGFSLPKNVVTKNIVGQEIVWVKTAPEIFKSLPVITKPLDANNIVITSGLDNGDRVVIQNSNLLNLIR